MKITNPAKMTDTQYLSLKNQAKMATTMQKIGRTKRKIVITLSRTSQKYLLQMVKEMKKQLVANEKQLANVFSFFNYLEGVLTVKKKQKMPKIKAISISYEEQDYLVMQIKSSINEINNQRLKLRWYNFFKKMAFSALMTQNEKLLKEVLNK